MQIGDKAHVIKKVEQSDGWNDCLAREMDTFVGKIGTVSDFYDGGIIVKFDGGEHWNFPKESLKQYFTPKFWIGWNKNSNEYFLESASKCKHDVLTWMEIEFGEDWYMDENFSVDLFELNMVKFC